VSPARPVEIFLTKIFPTVVLVLAMSSLFVDRQACGLRSFKA
jgi:hypothetical protein